MLRSDLAVVGAGPAGAAAALRARQLAPRARVVLLDRATFPRDKPCGDGISSHSIAELAVLDALGVVDGYEPIHNLHVRSPLGVEVVAPPPLPCVVVPRKVFDARLVAAAVARGVELRLHRVRTLELRGDVVVIDGEIEARTVIGADGANSVVRRRLGVAPNSPEHTAIAVRGYADEMPGRSDEMVVVMEESGSLAYAWAFPLTGGGANVGYGRSVADARTDDGGGVGELESRMRRLLPIGGSAELRVRELRAHRLPLATAPVRQPDGRVLFAGDALSYVNPITGEGIHHALRTGRMAAEEALGAAGGQAGAAYRRSLDRAFGKHLRQTAVMSRLCRVPGFPDAAFDLAGRRQDVWHSICDMGLGSGTISPVLIARQVAAYTRWRVRGATPSGRRRVAALRTR
jgi:geranylgeranyl reductase family protein